MKKWLISWAAALLVVMTAGSVVAQVRQIDPANSKITIHAYKTGVFSFAAGHDHVVEAPITSGQVDEGGRTVVVEVETKNLKVLDPGESEKNRAEIQQTMLSDKLLDAEKFPVISFRSTAYKEMADRAEVRGELSLHGQVQPVTVMIKKDGNGWTGSTRLKQTDFGMQPVSVAGGTVKVKDEVKIEFKVAVR